MLVDYIICLFCLISTDLQSSLDEMNIQSETGMLVLLSYDTCVHSIFYAILTFEMNLGYWHHRADERYGNPPPR